MLAGVDWIVGWTVLVLKRRWRLLATSLALLLVAFASLLYVNAPVADAIVDERRRLGLPLFWASLGCFYVVVGFGVFRLAHPESWWARRFYGPDRLAAANLRWSHEPGSPEH